VPLFSSDNGTRNHELANRQTIEEPLALSGT
jgi:hypothetical protein